MDTTGVGPEALREGLWAQQKWDDEKIAIDQVMLSLILDASPQLKFIFTRWTLGMKDV